MMRLVVTTPLAVIIDEANIVYLRAEDASGAFGILPRHADFLTVLSVSTLMFRRDDGSEHFMALRGGVLRVSGGRQVDVASRRAIAEGRLEDLGEAVVARFREEYERERAASAAAARMHLAAIRQIERYVSGETRRTAAFGRLAPGREERS